MSVPIGQLNCRALLVVVISSWTGHKISQESDSPYYKCSVELSKIIYEVNRLTSLSEGEKWNVIEFQFIYIYQFSHENKRINQ